MFEQTFKNIDDILHKDAGCSSELDFVDQKLFTYLKKFKAEKADATEYKIGLRLPVVPLPEHHAQIDREEKILLRIEGHNCDAYRTEVKGCTDFKG